MFIHQESILNRPDKLRRKKSLSVNFADPYNNEIDGSCLSVCSRSALISVSSVDQVCKLDNICLEFLKTLEKLVKTNYFKIKYRNSK